MACFHVCTIYYISADIHQHKCILHVTRLNFDVKWVWHKLWTHEHSIISMTPSVFWVILTGEQSPSQHTSSSSPAHASTRVHIPIWHFQHKLVVFQTSYWVSSGGKVILFPFGELWKNYEIDLNEGWTGHEVTAGDWALAGHSSYHQSQWGVLSLQN